MWSSLIAVVGRFITLKLPATKRSGPGNPHSQPEVATVYASHDLYLDCGGYAQAQMLIHMNGYRQFDLFDQPSSCAEISADCICAAC